ncbi:EAL domain-containing protein [Burkholderia cepacia]|nr:EAL domain-containing protein [Burkholderia cepacia]
MENISKLQSQRSSFHVWPWSPALGILPIVVVIVALAGFVAVSLIVIMSLRVYVGGESSWSKAQKDEIILLSRYGQTGDEKLFDDYLAVDRTLTFLGVARRAMISVPPDHRVARQALIEAGINPVDAVAVVWFYPILSSFARLNAALQYWEDADRQLVNLRAIANALRESVQAGDVRRTSRLNRAIWDFNSHIEPLPKRFSDELSAEFRSAVIQLFLSYVVASLLILLLSASGLDPALLCFEITETSAVRNLEVASRFMYELRDLGCRFALDDFGAGMSSFSYLRQLPIDYLKIDGGLVATMTSDSIKRGIASAINDIAHVMQYRTVAEHVEDAATAEMLRALGVDYCQGYYFSRPAPWQEGGFH